MLVFIEHFWTVFSLNISEQIFLYDKSSVDKRLIKVEKRVILFLKNPFLHSSTLHRTIISWTFLTLTNCPFLRQENLYSHISRKFQSETFILNWKHFSKKFRVSNRTCSKVTTFPSPIRGCQYLFRFKRECCCRRCSSSEISCHL